MDRILAERRRRRREDSPQDHDYSLLFIILFLLAFGLVMLYSTSSYEAAMSRDSNYDGAYYLKRQLIFTILGLLVMFVTSRINYRVWKKASVIAYLISLFLVVLIIPFGTEVNGAKRWLYFGPVSVQPAEIVKIATIMIVSAFLTKKGTTVDEPRNILQLMGITAVPALMLLIITKNLSSALIVCFIAVAMFFVCSRKKKIFILGNCGVAAAVALVIFLVNQYPDLFYGNYRFRRIMAWLDPESYAGDIAFQTVQALYAIGSGGVFGKGLGQSMQKLGYLPEAQNDMIFSIVCEELGLFGAACIMSMFLLLIWRFMNIAVNTYDRFGMLLVTGVMTHIAVQVLLNIGVVTNSIPNTGVTLPFVSYGGSAAVMLLFEVGIVLSVERRSRLRM